MDNSENNTSTHYIPESDHNSFAKIIKNLFEKDFTFNDCWYERITTNEVDLWKKSSSCRFKNIIFKTDGAFEKYLRKHFEKSTNYEDFEEFGRAISIYRSIILNKATSKIRSYIEKECREVFYEREISNKIGNYNFIHKKKILLQRLWWIYKYASIKEENTTVKYVVKNKHFKESVKTL